MLKRGDYVIMNDVDCPEARLVAVLTRYDDRAGVWHALYLATYTNMVEPHGTKPTLLADFGMKVEWEWDEYRVVPTGEPCTATYRDGKPRQWQDRFGWRTWKARKKAAKFCGALAWQPMDLAPRDGTAIQAEIPGNGSDNIIAWDASVFLDSEGKSCGGWYFVEDQEPPSCWTDGVCWEVNEDGAASVKPTRCRKAPAFVNHADGDA